MYKITTPNKLYLVGKVHEILDILDVISRDHCYLKTYLETQKN